MPTFLQSCQGKNINGTPSVGASAIFGAANTLGSLIAVACLFFSHTVGVGGDPGIVVTDTQGNSYGGAIMRQTYLGGGVTLAVFGVLSCLAGSNTLTAKASSLSGAIFLSAHEVAPDAGQVWKVNGNNFGSVTASAVLQMSPFGNNGPYNGTNYSFVCSGIDSDNQQMIPYNTLAVWNSRTYNPNTTPIDTGATYTGGAELFFYGALCTIDSTNASRLDLITGNTGTSNRPIYTAESILINFVSTIPAADAPTATPPSGTYIGSQSVTLFQDQGYSMYYTLDGSTPTTSSTPYTGAISITSSDQINVLVHHTGVADTYGHFFYTITPPPPPNSTINITWERRTRVGGAWSDGSATVPLSEESEKYDLEIWSDDGTVLVRTVAGLTVNSYTYTPAMQYTDFGLYKSSLYVKVYQISAVIGRGFAAINPKVGLGGQTPGGGSDATSILGVTISGSPADGDILRYNSGTGTWNIIGPVLKRQTLTLTSGSLANNATQTGSFAINCGMFGLIKIHVDRNCRIQLYSTAAFRDADSGRGYDIQPAVGTETGLIADFGFDSGGSQQWVCSPAVLGANVDASPIQNVYYRITNLSGSTSTVSTDLTIVPLEILP